MSSPSPQGVHNDGKGAVIIAVNNEGKAAGCDKYGSEMRSVDRREEDRGDRPSGGKMGGTGTGERRVTMGEGKGDQEDRGMKLK